MVLKFTYYDRKEDDDLPIGAIDRAVRRKNITIEEMTEQFDKSLRKSMKGLKR